MNLHTIKSASLADRPEIHTFLKFCEEEWAEWKLEIRGNEVWECERVYIAVTDEYEYPEDGWKKWSPSLWREATKAYHESTGIQIEIPT